MPTVRHRDCLHLTDGIYKLAFSIRAEDLSHSVDQTPRTLNGYRFKTNKLRSALNLAGYYPASMASHTVLHSGSLGIADWDHLMQEGTYA